MKKQIIVLCGLIISSSLLFSSSADAVGLGFYATGSSGSYKLQFDETDPYEITGTPLSYDMKKLCFGILLDTAVAKDRVFNYRLNIGGGSMELTRGNTTIKGHDYHLYNDFGFGIVRTEDLRFWLGPQIGIGYTYGEFQNTTGLDYNEFWTVYGSLGLVAGLNINIGDVLTLGLDGGYRYQAHGGGADYGTYEYDVSGKGGEFFAGIALIFRIRDTYERN